jgi:L-lysine 2,3-aminomutase
MMPAMVVSRGEPAVLKPKGLNWLFRQVTTADAVKSPKEHSVVLIVAPVPGDALKTKLRSTMKKSLNRRDSHRPGSTS